MHNPRRSTAVLGASLLVLLAGCKGAPPGGGDIPGAPAGGATTFDEIASFVAGQGEAVVLEGAAGARVLVSPTHQGRIFTMKVGSVESTGLVNQAAIAKGEADPSFNNFGGLDRFWLTPEGGQFSIYFDPKEKFPSGMFERDRWVVPAAIDRGAYRVVSRAPDRMVMERDMELVNYSSTRFKLRVEREVGIVKAADLPAELGIRLPEGVKYAGAYSRNVISNAGEARWTEEGGLVGIWILGQFNPSDSAVIIGPFRPGLEAELGPRFNDDYFGKLSVESPDRFKVLGNAVLLRADARREGKFGIPPKRTTGLAGSIDFQRSLLTIVKFDFPQMPERYANQSWETRQTDPFKGDALQSYNAGPADKGSRRLAPVPFYELESTSPVRPLAPGEKLLHRHATFHFQGDLLQLAPIARQLLGVELGAVKEAMLR